jgi:TetR/AcrR family transcriptional regulator, tetracycline repressor protein
MTDELVLAADEIIAAAVEILRERGLDAISMRSVATRLGVTPPPVYARIGNKEALIDAVADHLLIDLAPPPDIDEPWPDYARRWTQELRSRLVQASDSRLILEVKRPAYVEASRPLIECMRRGGLSAEMSVRACRLLTWATVGFVATGHAPRPTSTRRGVSRLPGSDPTGVTPEEIDELFALQIQFLIDGLLRQASLADATKSPTASREKRDG